MCVDKNSVFSFLEFTISKTKHSLVKISTLRNLCACFAFIAEITANEFHLIINLAASMRPQIRLSVDLFLPTIWTFFCATLKNYVGKPKCMFVAEHKRVMSHRNSPIRNDFVVTVATDANAAKNMPQKKMLFHMETTWKSVCPFV